MDGKSYKLLLINPVYIHRGLGGDSNTKMLPLCLAYVAGCTPPNYSIKLVDESFTRWEFEDADIVGITAFTSHAPRAYEIAQTYKEKNIPVVMGGIHASMLPDEALQFCTSVVIGEAESIWKQVLADFEAGGLQQKYKAPVPDIAALPSPRMDLLEKNPYHWHALQTSRGCPNDCSFCSVTRFNGRKYRRRPLQAVMDDLVKITHKYIFIVDDNLLGYGDTDWLYAFFEEILKRKVRKSFFAQASIKFGEDRKLIRLAARAGLKLIFTGIESVNYNTLKSFNKNVNAKVLNENRYTELITNIRKGGIAFMGAFIIGSDEDSLETFSDTLAFIKKAGIDAVQLTKPTPLPGTRFYEILAADNRITVNNYPEDWCKYTFSRLVFQPHGMSPEEIYAGFYHLRKDFFSYPVKIKRYLSTLWVTKRPSAALISYLMNRTYEKIYRTSVLYSEMRDQRTVF